MKATYGSSMKTPQSDSTFDASPLSASPTAHAMGWREDGRARRRGDVQRKLQRGERRSAAGRSVAQLNRGWDRRGSRNERNQTEFGLKRNCRTVEHRASGAHPRTQHGTMGCSLMVGMVPSMLDRLSLCQSADRQDTAHQEDCDKFKGSTVHKFTG